MGRECRCSQQTAWKRMDQRRPAPCIERWSTNGATTLNLMRAEESTTARNLSDQQPIRALQARRRAASRIRGASLLLEPLPGPGTSRSWIPWIVRVEPYHTKATPPRRCSSHAAVHAPIIPAPPAKKASPLSSPAVAAPAWDGVAPALAQILPSRAAMPPHLRGLAGRARSPSCSILGQRITGDRTAECPALCPRQAERPGLVLANARSNQQPQRAPVSLKPTHAATQGCMLSHDRDPIYPRRPLRNILLSTGQALLQALRPQPPSPGLPCLLAASRPPLVISPAKSPVMDCNTLLNIVILNGLWLLKRVCTLLLLLAARTKVSKQLAFTPNP